jgi:hypothetical protein
MIAHNTWQSAGGSGDLFVSGSDGTLVVSQTQQTHSAIEQLLGALRSGADPAATNDDRRVHEALLKQISLDCHDEPLSRVLADLGELSSLVNIRLDRPALEEERVTGDSLVTLRVQNMPLASALRHLLDPLNLTFLVQDGFLVITSQLDVGNSFEPRLYPVADLIDDGDGGVDCDSLIRLIEAVACPRSCTDSYSYWQPAPLAIECFAPKALLGILDTSDGHTLIERLLATIRNGEGRLESDEDARISHLLKTQLARLNFCREPLDRAIRRIGEIAGISNVVLDRLSIEQEGLEVDTPVSLQVANSTIAAALSKLLRPLNAAAVVRANALVVVGATEASQELRIRAYPAANLLTKTRTPDDLRETVMQSVAQTSWSAVGGSGVIEFFPNSSCLVVLQTAEIHDEIDAFLAVLRNTSAD